MQPNQVLSPELKVTHLKEGEIAVYKLCASDEEDPSRMEVDNGVETGRKRMKTPGYLLSPKYAVYDPKKGQKVIIGNVVGLRQEVMPDKSTKDIPVLGAIRFEMGKAITVTSNENAKYEFLERLEINSSNPFRQKGKRSVFYRVNDRKVAEDKNYKNLVLADALSWITNADHIEIKTINESLPSQFKLNLNDNWEIIKDKLFELTMKDPIMVMKASNNDAVKIKIQVMDAAKYAVIVFDEGDGKRQRTWFSNRGDKPVITTVDVGKNKIDALVNFFMTSDGAKHYKGMVAEMKVFLKSGSPDIV